MTETTDDNAGNPIGDARDAELVELGGEAEAGQMASVEMMRRLKRTIAQQQASTNALNERIRRLNLWLLVVTAAIGVLTAAQVYAAFWGATQPRAWVLWQQLGPSSWEPLDSFEKKSVCDATSGKLVKTMLETEARKAKYIACFPDTVDPRGAKGK